jgi:hypothetical protein
MKQRTLLLLAFLFVFTSLSIAQTSNVVRIDIPGAQSTWVTGINDNKDICGYYLQANGRYRSFILTKEGEIIKIFAPEDSSLNIYAKDINRIKSVVGRYELTGPADAKGFSFNPILDENTAYEVTALLGQVEFITLNGINDSTCFVGDYKVQTTRRAFYRCSGDPVFSAYDYNLTLPTYGKCINNHKDFAGFYIDAGNTIAFIRRNDGEEITFSNPSSNKTRFWGCNDNDKFVGDINNNTAKIFSYSGGAFTVSSINIQGATSSIAMDINNEDEVVGYYTDASGQTHGYVYKSVFLNGFNPATDGWSFDNESSALWPQSVWTSNNYAKDLYQKNVLGRTINFPKNPKLNNQVFFNSTFPSWEYYVELLGTNSVYSNVNTGDIKRRAFDYFVSIIDTTWGGSCFGMTASALLYKQMKNDFINKFPMSLPENLYDAQINPTIRKYINLIQIYQAFYPFNYDFVRNENAIGNATLSELKERFLINQPEQNSIISIYKSDTTATGQPDCYKKKWGHALTPFKVVKNDDESHTVYIYDPNKHGDNTRKIQVSSNFIWSYDCNVNANQPAEETNNANCNNHFFNYGPVSELISNNPSVRLNGSNSSVASPLAVSKPGTLLHSVNKSSYFLAVNDLNDTTGFFNQRVLEQIDSSFIIKSINRSSFSIGNYILPSNQSYEVSVRNIKDDYCLYTIFNENSHLQFKVPNNNQQEVHTFSSSSGSVNYTNSGNEIKNIEVTAVYTGNDAELVYSITDINLNPNQTIGLEIINDFQLLFTNETSDVDFNMNISLAGENGVQNFTASDIPLNSNSEYLIVPSLDNFSDQPVEVQLDNNANGSVDSTFFLENSAIPALNVNVSELNFDNSGGFNSMFISNLSGGTLNWSVSSQPDWIQLNTSSGVGNTQVEITAESNPDPASPREGWIIVNASSGSPSIDSVKVTQGDLVLNIKTESVKAFQANIFPNPANKECTIEIKNTVQSFVKYRITDLGGKIVKEGRFIHLGAGDSMHPINIESINSGFYQVELTIEKTNASVNIPLIISN